MSCKSPKAKWWGQGVIRPSYYLEHLSGLDGAHLVSSLGMEIVIESLRAYTPN
jgi:hypothetical protein